MDSLPKVREATFQPVFNYTAPDFFSFSSIQLPLRCVVITFAQNSPGNLSMSNQPGTPREDGEMGGNFLNPFQNESVSQMSSTVWDD